MSRGISAGACLLLAVGLLAGDSPPPTAEARALIKTIRAVGKGGEGNAEAARAWKAIVAAGPDALPAILGALNDDEAVAGNWLQPAFDAIAEKAARNRILSTEVLREAVADKK